MPQALNRTKNPAFTLVEILVVIGIIALLSAILFPVASGVRESGRRTACASNMQQIGLALNNYIADHANRYPPASNFSCNWVDSIFPYAKSAQIFKCPNVRYGEYRPGCQSNDELVGETMVTYVGSYDYITPYLMTKTEVTENPSGGTSTTTTTTIEPKGFPALRYRFPSTTYLLVDSAHETYPFHTISAAVNPGMSAISGPDDLIERGIVARHWQGNNMMFVDGHAKWIGTDDLVRTGPWRPDGQDNPAASTP